jgi:molecular chaperone DnaJ
MADHYSTLGVSRDATSDEIKKAYRKLAREFHPDVNPDPASSEKFKDVTTAYEVLSDDEKRSRYDRGGDPFSQGGGFGGGNFGFDDLLGAFFGQGQSRGPRSRARAGQDALIGIELDLAESCFGCEKEFTVDTAVRCTKCSGTGCAGDSKPQSCPICKGQGEIQQVTRSFIGNVMTSRPCNNCGGYGSVIPTPCAECAGEGRVRERRTLTVKIPAGVETGNRIAMAGQGEVGPGGGPAGDLYIEIIERPHSFLVRDGLNLHISITISMVAATMGTKVKIETLDGPQEVEIKAGFQSADTVTLRGLGVSKLRGNGRGDLIVHVEVKTPAKLKRDEEELLKKFAALRGEKLDQVEVHSRDKHSHEHGFFSKFRDAFNR